MQEDRGKFKANLRYRIGPRPAWAGVVMPLYQTMSGSRLRQLFLQAVVPQGPGT